uniref:Family with sequence similarity 110 member C n=1 Tax=Hippocampus comes TaxID=109280 RepID=A0A3Q2YWP4_HIPCM
SDGQTLTPGIISGIDLTVSGLMDNRPMSAVERLAASKPKYVKSHSLSSNWIDPDGGKEEPGTPEESAREHCSSAKTPTLERRRNGATRNLKSGPKETSTNLLNVPVRRGKGVGRSRSDISSRYSKNFADFDSFFKYCGLDGEVIESLGKENFSARSDEMTLKVRSVSVATSDGGFSRNSDDSEGLQEDVLHKKIRQGTSVIERNARIIKWLYSCKNAKESGKKLRDLD